jgi:pyruvate,orthophosphate dikinase
MGDDCGAGLAWSRNPSTGAKEDDGIYLRNAQGDDLRSRTRRPTPLAQIESDSYDIRRQIRSVRAAFDSHSSDDYMFDFTVEHGKVYVVSYSTVPGSSASSKSLPRPAVPHLKAA